MPQTKCDGIFSLVLLRDIYLSKREESFFTAAYGRMLTFFFVCFCREISLSDREFTARHGYRKIGLTRDLWLMRSLLLRRTLRYFTIAYSTFRPNECSPVQEENVKLQTKAFEINDRRHGQTYNAFTLYVYVRYDTIVFTDRILCFWFYFKNMIMSRVL